MKITPYMAAFAVLSSAVASSAAAQSGLTTADYQRAEQALSKHTSKLVTNTVEAATWYENDVLIYRSQTPQGHIFKRIDAGNSQTKPAFDHKRLASSLSALLTTEVNDNALPFKYLSYQ